MRPALLTAIALAALAACKGRTLAASPDPSSEPSASPTAATPLPAAFEGELIAHGVEPFWSVEIEANKIRFSTPEGHVDFPNEGGAMVAGKAVWQSARGNETLRVTLTEQPGCSDGMSDLSYPLAAEVVVGEATYQGCASKRSERPTEGQGTDGAPPPVAP